MHKVVHQIYLWTGVIIGVVVLAGIVVTVIVTMIWDWLLFLHSTIRSVP